MQRLVVVLLLSLVAALTAPVAGRAASAQEPAFTIRPLPDGAADVSKGYFVFTSAAGTSAAGSVGLANTSAQPVTVQLAMVDALTAQNGGSAFAATGEQPSAAGTWVQLATTSVTLSPGEQQRVPFTVQIPADVQPGQYLAGLAAYVADAAVSTADEVGANRVGALVRVQQRYVVSVQVEVPGAWTPSLSVAGVTILDYPSGRRLGVQLKNDGTAFIKPAGTVTLLDEAGQVLAAEPVALGLFITGTTVTYPVKWPPQAGPGRYNVRVELGYGDGQQAAFAGPLMVEAPGGATPAAARTDSPASDRGRGAVAPAGDAVSQPGAEAPASDGVVLVGPAGVPAGYWLIGAGLLLALVVGSAFVAGRLSSRRA